MRVRLLVFLLAVAMMWPSIGSFAADLESLEIFQEDWPRAFFFRSSEGLAASGERSYEQWESVFLPLNGIMGKCLEEEVPGRTAAQPYFARYKREHPEKVVLLHFNGNGTDPRFEAGEFFAGHWLYYNGSRIARDVPAEKGPTTLHVDDPSLFRVDMGRYGNANEEVCICRLDEQGKPDWNYAEQARIVSVDAGAKTLTVERGLFGTRPLGFEGGKAYVASHATRGPWGGKSNLVWLYNYATTCPRNARGRTCNDVVVGNLKRWFGPGGPLETFDGIQFDAAPFSKSLGGARGIDADGDGQVDYGRFEGRNVFGLGVYEYHQMVREALGPDRLILADGGTPGAQRSIGALNGIESEGWPHLSDWEIVDWSGGLNRHFFWRDNAVPPVLNYINHKYRAHGDRERVDAPVSTHRLVLAVALLTDSAVTYSTKPPGQDEGPVPVWDELRRGTAHESNWLGKPRGETIRLGLRAPDLLEGAGVEARPEFVERWTSSDATVLRDDGGQSLKIVAKDPDAPSMRLLYGGLDLPEGDLLVRCEIAAEPLPGYPQAIPRLVWLGCKGAGQLISADLPRAGSIVRGQPERPLDTAATGASIRYESHKRIGGESHEAYQVHPPYGNMQGPGAVFWEADVRLPASPCFLRFHTGLAETAKRSDGVAFRVSVKADGPPKTVFEIWHKKMEWVQREANLSPWAGRHVTLRFTVDSGPNDSSTADHAVWGDVSVGGFGRSYRRSPQTPGRIMALANAKPLEATFYFRDAGPAAVDLSVEIEGAAPARISNFTVHAATDALAREFANGVVLANPALREYTFDLGALFPGIQLKRLQGSPAQDPEVNNGRLVGESVTLGGRDGLFLERNSEAHGP